MGKRAAISVTAHLRGLLICSFTAVTVSAMPFLPRLVSAMVCPRVFLQASPSVMDVVSRLCTLLYMRQTPDCMPFGLHLVACDTLGTALRSPSDI